MTIKLFPNLYNTEWQKGYKETITITNVDNIYTFHNIRDYNHIEDKLFYKKEIIDINLIDNIILYSIPFGFNKLFSHLILEFHFQNNTSIFLSVEARRQPGEGFSIIKGLFRHYGLSYLWGTERDLIGVRRDVRQHRIDKVQLNISKQNMKEGLLYFIKETSIRNTFPIYYNALFNNCTTTLWFALKKISSKRIPISYKVIFSAYIFDYLTELEIINSEDIAKIN